MDAFGTAVVGSGCSNMNEAVLDWTMLRLAIRSGIKVLNLSSKVVVKIG